jgi:CubicO group peptidase (beta-lactamase class C family)
MKNTITSLMFILWAAIGFSQSFNTQKLDSLFNLLDKNNKFMGSVAVSQNQKAIYQNSIGFASIDQNIKANNLTNYRVGSVSKMFTATLVLKAVEEQKLKLNQTIEHYFPDIKNSEKITIKNLLNHSSGVHDFTSEKDYLQWNTKNLSKKDLIDRISNGDSEFAPNEKSKYSNSNYVLLTFILENVYGRPFSELLKEKITKPLHLKNTYYGSTININNNESVSYSYLGKWKLEPETNLSIPQGAGGIVSNPTDLNLFTENLFLGNIVSKQSLETMKTIEKKYGFGMFKFSYLDELNFGHTGGIDGFRSFTIYFPKDKLAISMTSNALNYSQKEILIAISNTFHHKTIELPTFSEIKVTSEDLDKYLGIYSSEEIPPKITITKEGNTLIAQVTGQSAFPLESTSENVFTFNQAGVKIEFNPSEKTMILYQGGGEFNFKMK